MTALQVWIAMIVGIGAIFSALYAIEYLFKRWAR